MIGSRIESRRSLPWGALFLLTIGLAMLVGGVVIGQTMLAIGAVLPISVGLTVLLFGSHGSFVAEFSEDSIEVEHPPASISYESLRDVRAGGVPHDPFLFRKPTSLIQVEHDGGVLLIPPRLNVPSHEVYRFLTKQVPLNGDRAVNPALAEYLERQESYFGAEHIWTYRAATRRSRSGQYRMLRAFCVGLMLAGAIWAGIGFGGVSRIEWGGAGIMCGLIGVCFYLASLTGIDEVGRLIPNWKKSSLVIGPQGMAMVQGDLQGEVRWPELLEVRFRPNASAFRYNSAQGMKGIIIKVKGADILIADIYDRPLYVIHERILAASGRSFPEEIEL